MVQDTDASLTESESEESAIQRPDVRIKRGKASVLNRKNEKGETKLHAQVIAGNLGAVRRLLEEGAYGAFDPRYLLLPTTFPFICGSLASHVCSSIHVP